MRRHENWNAHITINYIYIRYYSTEYEKNHWHTIVPQHSYVHYGSKILYRISGKVPQIKQMPTFIKRYPVFGVFPFWLQHLFFFPILFSCVHVRVHFCIPFFSRVMSFAVSATLLCRDKEDRFQKRKSSLEFWFGARDVLGTVFPAFPEENPLDGLQIVKSVREYLIY